MIDPAEPKSRGRDEEGFEVGPRERHGWVVRVALGSPRGSAGGIIASGSGQAAFPAVAARGGSDRLSTGVVKTWPCCRTTARPWSGWRPRWAWRRSWPSCCSTAASASRNRRAASSTRPLTGLHAPELLPGVDGGGRAPARRRRAPAAGICVYGDYDVDGVTGTAILLQVPAPARRQGRPLRAAPARGGLRPQLRGPAATSPPTGVSLVVTVDCGIASVAEAEEARRLGLELIVTDHHEMKDTLPDAAVLVHPRLPGDGLPVRRAVRRRRWRSSWRGRCAAGQRRRRRCTPRFREFLLDAVALAALGVVADVVPLHDENRILVRHGLQPAAAGAAAGPQGAVRGGRPGRGRRRARLRHRLQDSRRA